MQQTDKNPPAVRHSTEQINDIVARYDPRQGLSIKKYCKLHRISEQSFYSARSRIQANGSTRQGFIALSPFTLNNFTALVQYTCDGMLSIDNNILEGQIRSIALGRLNHMFAGSHRGGELAAIIYSFMATCKLQGIDPAQWLDDVLRRIPGQPEDKLRELLPQFWKPQNAEQAKSA